MPLVNLRIQPGTSTEGDLIVEVKDNTFEYLLTSPAPTIRLSTYLDRDWPLVKAYYAELDLGETCPFHSKIVRVTPGSRVRTGIQLPGPMQQGEQLVIEVSRTEVSRTEVSPTEVSQTPI